MKQLSMFDAMAAVGDSIYFDGETYEPDRDKIRLTGQLLRTYEVMRDGRWHTLTEIAERAHGSPQSVSARLRDLRKKRFGAYEVERKRHDYLDGVWLYRLVL